MTHSLPSQQETQISNLRQMLVWTLRMIVALTVLCFVLDHIFQADMLQNTGWLAFALCCSTLLKLWLLKHGRYRTFIAGLGIELSLFGFLLTAVSYLTLPIIVLYPVIIFVCSSVFASGLWLRCIVGFSLAASLATFVVNFLWSSQLAAPWYIRIMVMAGVIVTQMLALLLVWQARKRQAALLAQFQCANSALEDMRGQLEQTVNARTSELAQTVSLLQATLDSTTDGILAIDTHDQVVAWNRRFATMWRIPDDLAEQRNNQRLLSHVSDQLLQPEQFFQELEHLSKQPDVESYHVLHFKDGRVFERYIHPQSVEAKSIGWVVSFRDITEWICAEERAKAFAELGKELSATVTVEDAARIIIAAADELFGWDACYLDFYYPQTHTLETIVCFDTINGKRVETPLPPPSTITFAEQRIIRRGPQLILREPEEPDPGDLMPFGDVDRPSASLMFAPILRGDETVGVLSIQSYTHNAYTQADLEAFQNLASHSAGALERNRTEAQLRLAEEERQQLERKMLETQKRESLGLLAGGIAHDFNNLLTVMQGNMSLARLDLHEGHVALESLQQAEIAARRAADLTRQMLAYAGKGRLAVERVALNDVIGEMRDLLHASLPKHVRFEYEFGPNLPAIEADATQIRQVVINLIMNAAEAIGGNNGTVIIRSRLLEVSKTDLVSAAIGSDGNPGTYVALEVEDTGIGMDMATLQRIFEPFFSTKFTGRGLGLSAVLGIIRSHHGAIRVSSERGCGTQFQVLLPPATPAPSQPLPEEQQEPWHGSGSALIIDDEPAILTLVGRMVQQIGFTPYAANDGNAGVARYQALKGDVAVVMLDLTMPGKNAQQVLADFHAINPDTPVLLMSGYTEQDAQSLLRHPQVVGFLHKPFRLAELRNALQLALGAKTAD